MPMPAKEGKEPVPLTEEQAFNFALHMFRQFKGEDAGIIQKAYIRKVVTTVYREENAMVVLWRDKVK